MALRQLKEMIEPASEAGGESDSPRRGQPSLGRRKPKMYGAYKVDDGGRFQNSTWTPA